MNSSKAEHEEDSCKTEESLEVNDLNEAPKELALSQWDLARWQEEASFT